MCNVTGLNITNNQQVGKRHLPLGGVLEGHAESHLLAEVIRSDAREDECFILTGAHSLEIWLTATH